MIIIKLKGGLGNQLFQYALGRKLAIARNVDLKFDRTFYERNSARTYLLDNFNICGSVASVDQIHKYLKPTNNTLHNFYRHVSEAVIPIQYRNFVLENRFAYDKNINLVGNDVYLDGYWQTEKFFIDIQKILTKDLTIKYPLSIEVLSIAKRIMSDNSISIHIRRGDYAANPISERMHGVCPISYYRDALEYLCEKIPSPTAYVFSDDIQWAKKNLILDIPIEYVSGNVSRYVIDDFYLMSLCKHHIIANSTFSWWGAWLADNPAKIVIAPSKWFNNSKHDTRDIIPNQWIKM